VKEKFVVVVYQDINVTLDINILLYICSESTVGYKKLSNARYLSFRPDNWWLQQCGWLSTISWLL